MAVESYHLLRGVARERDLRLPLILKHYKKQLQVLPLLSPSRSVSPMKTPPRSSVEEEEEEEETFLSKGYFSFNISLSFMPLSLFLSFFLSSLVF